MAGTAEPFATRGDLPTMSRRIRQAHEHFVTTGSLNTTLRDLVASSWQRSATSGADPSGRRLAPVDFTDDELADYRDAHPLAAVMPVIRRLLIDDAHDNDVIVAVGDAQGHLLWVDGASGLRSAAEQMHFVEGSRWREEDTGTNAPGTALAIGQPVQIFGSEHFSAAVHGWSCAATPIRDPRTGTALGIIDVTGGDHVAAPHMLTLVRSTAAACEAELKVQLLTGTRAPSRAPAPRPEPTGTAGRLDVLGCDGVLHTGTRRRVLSLRLSECLFLMTMHPRGLSAEQLALGLYEHPPSPVTVRAEMTRLRRILGADVLASRPYRLATRVDTDAAELARLLDRGAHRRALDLYAGPILPASTAPAIVDARLALQSQLRRAMLDHAGADVLLTYARQHAPDDVEVWEAVRDALPYGSPRRSQVDAHLARLDTQLGV